MAAHLILGFAAGLLIAAFTSPVGVSGAVFMLPFQLSILAVANPAVTPTNLLYNVVAGPGALLRYRRNGQLTGPLARLLIAGTAPGVVIGAVVRVLLLPGPRAFRVVAGLVLLALGAWLIAHTLRPPQARQPLSNPSIQALAFVVGIVGGVYGIGGGSILSPILVGSGMAVAVVAPAALAATFVTSIIGSLAFAVLSQFAHGSIAPDWPIGVACGLGGLAGGYVGALAQPRLPERSLRLLLAVVALGLGAVYLIQGLV
ncbi:MAG: sulfite exporter TauE/SafE family protein [Nocardioides sp.]